MASGTIKKAIPESMTPLFKVVRYARAWPSEVASGGTASFTANDFGFATPAGYSAVCFRRYTSGTVNAFISGLNPNATGTSIVMTFRNAASSAQSGKTAYVEVVYANNAHIAQS